MMADAQTEVGTMSFEAALAELESIVQKLEGGKAPLAESIAIYERGEALKSHCESLLKAAEARIEKITLKNGQPTGTAAGLRVRVRVASAEPSVRFGHPVAGPELVPLDANVEGEHLEIEVPEFDTWALDVVDR